MRDSALYLRAAECMDADLQLRGACAAILHATDSDEDCARYSLLCDEFSNWFYPGAHIISPYWGDAWEPDARECRVLALCFMAAIAETEQLL